jgi:cell filamentation protein
VAYRAAADPYCYARTNVLKNRLGLRSAAALRDFEAEITAQRASEPFPAGRLTITHYKAIHRHLFQDVYSWAGRYRTIRIHKDASTFCYPENIPAEIKKLFSRLRKGRNLAGLTAASFATEAAHFVAELNAIHPFREGNGRAQLAFLTVLADTAEHPLDLQNMRPRTMLDAMIASFGGNEAPLRKLIRSLI